MSDFIAHVIAELDTSKAEAQINALTNKKYKIQFDTINAVIRQIKRCLLRQIKTGFTEHLTMV